MDLNRSISILFSILYLFKKSVSRSTYLFYRLIIHILVVVIIQNVTCLPYLLLLGSLFFVRFVFINTDCGDFQTGIRIAVLAIPIWD